jgi:uncharacterized protein (DUF2141 family)
MPRFLSSALLLSLFSLALTLPATAQLRKSTLTVEVDGIKNKKGLLCLRLFSKSQNFPGGAGAASTKDCMAITDQTIKIPFRNLTPGSYAVAVFHDENGDRTLNRNGAGMPTEGFGFSNNPIIRQKAPSFGQAIVLVAGPNTGIKIQMKYSAGN